MSSSKAGEIGGHIKSDFSWKFPQKIYSKQIYREALKMNNFTSSESEEFFF